MLDNGRLGTDEFASHRPNSVDEVSIPVDRIEAVPQIGINPAVKKQIQAANRFLNIIHYQTLFFRMVQKGRDIRRRLWQIMIKTAPKGAHPMITKNHSSCYVRA